MNQNRMTQDYIAFPGTTEYIFDDSTSENGWAVNPGYIGWMGNEFPVPPTATGAIQSFKLYFVTNEIHGNAQVSIDVFDSTRNLIGSSGLFTPPNDDWVVVNVNNIPFTGKFYAMVKWNNTLNSTNWVGYDENGPYTAQDLAWYQDGTTWQKLSMIAANPGVFLLRATATLNIGIPELTGGSLLIYPNPCYDVITIEIPKSDHSQKTFSIINTLGIKVKTFTGISPVQHINVGDLPPGTYLVYVDDKENHYFGRFIVPDF
ncbi:MAG: T9SS type A sorting domain-containing protein [Bacteroidetes bacterium]|nr:T9SS type A sorting domain-containing protein [Bacteroidota bacterium]